MAYCDCGADDCPKCHPGCNNIVTVDCGCGEMVSHNVTSCEWWNRDVRLLAAYVWIAGQNKKTRRTKMTIYELRAREWVRHELIKNIISTLDTQVCLPPDVIDFIGDDGKIFLKRVETVQDVFIMIGKRRYAIGSDYASMDCLAINITLTDFDLELVAFVKNYFEAEFELDVVDSHTV